ncbi:MAG: hypothetical protein KA998_04430 [Rickettsiaceae bacterium]|nr:hypothetical protein [Rickettsiaceae bacterium]
MITVDFSFFYFLKSRVAGSFELFLQELQSERPLTFNQDLNILFNSQNLLASDYCSSDFKEGARKYFAENDGCFERNDRILPKGSVGKFFYDAVEKYSNVEEALANVEYIIYDQSIITGRSGIECSVISIDGFTASFKRLSEIKKGDEKFFEFMKYYELCLSNSCEYDSSFSRGMFLMSKLIPSTDLIEKIVTSFQSSEIYSLMNFFGVELPIERILECPEVAKAFWHRIIEAKGADGMRLFASCIYKEFKEAVAIDPKFKDLSALEAFGEINDMLTNQSSSEIISSLSHCYQPFQIYDETYSLKQEDGLYFSVTKVNAANKIIWDEFTKSNMQGKGNDGGIYAFGPALEFFSYLNTDLWVAFMSNKEISKLDNSNQSSVEMFMTIGTSTNSCFSTHTGINRANETFHGVIHNRISVMFHSFAAKFVLEHYGNKLYMMTCPEWKMTDIILKAFEIESKMDNIYLYRVENNYCLDSHCSEKQLSSCAHLKEIYSQQDQEIASGVRTSVVDFTDRFMVIKDHEGNVVSNIHMEDPELAYFLKHPSQYSSIGPGSPLLVCDLQALSGIGGFNDEIHLAGQDPTNHL